MWSYNRAEQSEYAIYIFVTSVYVFVKFFMIPSKIEMKAHCVSVLQVATKKSQGHACEKDSCSGFQYDLVLI